MTQSLAVASGATEGGDPRSLDSGVPQPGLTTADVTPCALSEWAAHWVGAGQRLDRPGIMHTRLPTIKSGTQGVPNS